MHAGDKVIAARECRAFNQAFSRLISPEAIWVNPLERRERAQAKPVQIHEALKLGLKVPPTLFSNDPSEIRRFIHEHDGQVIYKPFLPAQWTGETSVAMTFTTPITAADLPSDDLIQLSPGIFQRKIEKAYELRVTYMGDYCVVAKLLSQERDSSKIDWREAFLDFPVVPGELPEEVDRKCRSLMAALGLLFGCFDLIVTPNGDHIFLEINEMGQFLWIEQLNHSLLLLDPFSDFLIQGGKCAASWSAQAESLHCPDFLEDEVQQRMLQEDRSLHVFKPNYHSVDDMGTPPIDGGDLMSRNVGTDGLG